MDSSTLAQLKDLPSSTVIFLLIAVVLCRLSKQGCFSQLSSKQSFCVLMTAMGIFGIKLLF
ncbi:Uncharacterised protein [Yersinia ruckeri]|nr:Uncharacterised protein [Yersinia ruckeri]